jgi:hypothetical protein
MASPIARETLAAFGRSMTFCVPPYNRSQRNGPIIGPECFDKANTSILMKARARLTVLGVQRSLRTKASKSINCTIVVGSYGERDRMATCPYPRLVPCSQTQARANQPLKDWGCERLICIGQWLPALNAGDFRPPGHRPCMSCSQ